MGLATSIGKIFGAAGGGIVSAASGAFKARIDRKIREAEMSKVPAMLVVGAREAEASTVTVRRHGGEDRGSMSVAEFQAGLLDENRPHD